MISGKVIFISPIDWGLGHASRCVPIIRALSENNTVIIGTTSLNSFLFNAYFPELKKVEMPSYKISYSKRLPLWLKLIIQWPKIHTVIRREKNQLEQIVSSYKIDFIISDSRFGLTHPGVYSVFITHQLKLVTPFFSRLANMINRNYIHKFDEIWVPDVEGYDLRLSGKLSDSSQIKIPVKYIGPQSALTNIIPSGNDPEKYDYLILLSGVEPQRTILETILLKKLAHPDKKIVCVRGSNLKTTFQNKNIKMVDFCFGDELQQFIAGSKIVICRSGYSTLMDLNALKKNKLILIPTPGQSEQEYLGKLWARKFNAIHIDQSDLLKYKFD